MKRFIPFVISIAITVPAYPADKKGETPGITQDQATAILEELKQIHKLLERQVAAPAVVAPAPLAVPAARAKMAINQEPMLGSKTAPLTIVEFTDYQCPFCQQFHNTTFDEIRKKYIDTGKLRFVSRDLPLEMHPNAPRAAEAARCAGDQGQYWKMRDVMIANADKLSAADIKGYAQSLHLDITTFISCLDGNKYKLAVQKDMSEAASLNISGTPSFVIGKSTPDGVDGVVFVGAQPFGAFETKFNEIQTQK